MGIDWHPLSAENTIDAANSFNNILRLITELSANLPPGKSLELSREAIEGISNLLMMASTALETLTSKLHNCERKVERTINKQDGQKNGEQ